jgi:uncharacterized membrane protein YecN with MAPEG domain
MSAIDAATLYAGLNLLLLLALALLVVRQRMRHKVVLGDGGVEPLNRAIRVHGNAVEYAPLAVAGLVALALAGAAVWIVHVGGVALTLGRVLHAQGLSASSGRSFGRAAGTLLTWGAFLWIGGAAIAVALT